MPYRVGRRAWLIAIAALLSSPRTRFLRAQQPTQSIPVELATAYVRSVARTDSAAVVEFLTGDVPAAVREMIPVLPGSRVVGGVVVNRTTTVLATTTVAPDSVLAWYAATYAKRGFPAMALLRVQTSPPGIGGFRQPPPPHPSQFCSGPDQIDVSATYAPEGFTAFRIRLTRAAAFCRLVPPTAPRTAPRFNLPLCCQ